MDNSPSGPGTFRASLFLEKKLSYKNSVRFLIHEELLNLSKISHKDRDDELVKNREFFDISQDLSMDKDAKSTLLTEKAANMLSKEDLIVTGLSIETRNALDFVVFKTGKATKLYQRNLKALETDSLIDIQDRLETVKEDDPENLESIHLLEQEFDVILGEVCEREAAKLKTFKILHDKKTSK